MGNLGLYYEYLTDFPNKYYIKIGDKFIEYNCGFTDYFRHFVGNIYLASEEFLIQTGIIKIKRRLFFP